MVNMLLKMKFRELNCEYLLQKTASRTGWSYPMILDCLNPKGRDCKHASNIIHMKLIIVDLDVVLKAWMYFLHHTLDTNCGGSELIIVRALALYLSLTRRLVNTGHIISSDMDEMAHSMTKKQGTCFCHPFAMQEG